MISKTIQKLSDPRYRAAFVSSQIAMGIPFQIRALMRSRGWTQKELAERANMRQPTISALMKPGKTRPNIETLQRLAAAFDCGLMVRFLPFSELVRWNDEFDPEGFESACFGDDNGFDDVSTATAVPMRSSSLMDEEKYLRATTRPYQGLFVVPKNPRPKRRRVA